MARAAHPTSPRRAALVALVRRWRFALGLLVLPVAFLVFLRTMPEFDLTWFAPGGHLLVVTIIASCAIAVAIVAAKSAIETAQSGVVWLALGCSLIGLFLLGHGLVTPGAMDQPFNLWVARLPYGALAGFALCLLVAGTRPDRRVNRWVGRHPVATVALPMVPATLLVAVVVDDPGRLHGATTFKDENETFAFLAAAIIAAMLVVMWRHVRRWHLGKDPMQMALVVAAAMSIASVLSFEHGKFARVSWWDYHGYLLLGFGLAVAAVVVSGRRQHAITRVLADTFVDDPFEHIVRGYPKSMVSMVKAVEMKDAYTHGHSLRTAQLAVELGLQMSLPPDRLRVIARGACLHDLGKIAIPGEILRKAGPLTAEERVLVETHPELGRELAGAAASLREVLPVILHHHERFDGQGYPTGIAAAAIPLEARLVTVADVWDALTSDRAYRGAVDHAHALAHIEAGRGTHFDPVVVDALVRVLVNRGLRPLAEPGRADEAWTAAQTCHQIDAPSPVPVA